MGRGLIKGRVRDTEVKLGDTPYFRMLHIAFVIKVCLTATFTGQRENERERE